MAAVAPRLLGRMISRAGRVVALGALALAAGCGGAGGTVTGPQPRLTLEVAPAPPRVGPARLSLALSDAQGLPLRGASVRVEATMSHAGMTPEFADATEVAPGRYEGEIELTMGGDWILLVDATTAEGREHHWIEDVPGVSSTGSREGRDAD